MTPGFSFEVVAGDPCGARAGRLVTPHGVVATPAFMPCGTQGSVKGVGPRDLREAGTMMLLANAYHLHVRPGEETVAALGGLHRFMGWDGPILTDSGGYQVLSLADLRTVDDDGVTFRSHVDGERVRLTPESILDIQVRLGCDIAMVLDDCLPAGSERRSAERALDRTLAWAERSARHRERHLIGAPMALFGISQGCAFEDLRERSARRLAEMPFDGFAVGGVSVGEDRALLLATIPWGVRGLPVDRPRYLMGVGGLEEFLCAIEAGVDLFDCVAPTRNARNGRLLTRSGEPVRIRNRRWARTTGPIEEGCDCATCERFSLGYLHHLYNRKEILAATLGSLHNLRVFHRFLEEARIAIERGEWRAFAGSTP